MKKLKSYSQVKIITQDGLKFRDKVFNKFLALDGGIPLSTMIALAGTSGAGKTTLCKKLQKELPKDLISVFFSLETSKNSVARQTKRVKTGDNALVCDDVDFPTWGEFMKYLYTEKPTLVIVDSLQHAAKLLSKENGEYKYVNYAKIRQDLYDWKEKCNGIVFMIVQLNAEGKVEGPEATVFDVDIPLKLIADPSTQERHLEASKNRNGGTVGKIYYDFVSDDRIIQFYEEDEWKVIKKGESIADMVNTTIESYLKVYSGDDNFKAFSKEFYSRYDKIYNSSEDEVDVASEAIKLIGELSKEYFSK